jgi:hypothetical protein
VCKYVLPPCGNPIAVNKYIISYLLAHSDSFHEKGAFGKCVDNEGEFVGKYAEPTYP